MSGEHIGIAGYDSPRLVHTVLRDASLSYEEMQTRGGLSGASTCLHHLYAAPPPVSSRELCPGAVGLRFSFGAVELRSALESTSVRAGAGEHK
jgi:hypothetical protein